MQYLQVKNLEKYQPHYKDNRRLLWIRWDIAAMRDYKISKLTPAQRWLFIGLVCLATENNNQVPLDEIWLSRELGFLKNHIRKEIQMLQTLELIVTNCNNSSPTYIHTIHTDSTLQFPFEDVYKNYPNKVGKREALRHFEASVKNDQDWLDIQAALKNYLESERVAKGFVQNASTWFNNWRDWIKSPEGGVKFETKPNPDHDVCGGTGYLMQDGKKAKCFCW